MIRMKNQIPVLFSLAALFFTGACATEETVYVNEDAKRYFDAWLSVNHPEATPSGLGVYIIDELPGSGETIGDADAYLFVEYTVRDLDGNIKETTLEKISKQVGTYSRSNYYGPRVFLNNRAATPAGFLEMIKGMRVGGTRTAIVPGWLNVKADHETADDYLKEESGTAAIYTCKLTGKTDDINKWQIDSLERYVAKHMGDVDSTFYGYYYKQIRAPKDSLQIPRDTSFHINYTGRLLNGQVFDTTIRDTAKVHGIYSASKSYAPVQINMSESHSEITLGSPGISSGSTLVEGFSYCLSKMGHNEKGICAFYSPFGYMHNGSGNAIPGYSPISFEIELVDKAE